MWRYTAVLPHSISLPSVGMLYLTSLRVHFISEIIEDSKETSERDERDSEDERDKQDFVEEKYLLRMFLGPFLDECAIDPAELDTYQFSKQVLQPICQSLTELQFSDSIDVKLGVFILRHVRNHTTFHTQFSENILDPISKKITSHKRFLCHVITKLAGAKTMLTGIISPHVSKDAFKGTLSLTSVVVKEMNDESFLAMTSISCMLETIKFEHPINLDPEIARKMLNNYRLPHLQRVSFYHCRIDFWKEWILIWGAQMRDITITYEVEDDPSFDDTTTMTYIFANCAYLESLCFKNHGERMNNSMLSALWPENYQLFERFSSEGVNWSLAPKLKELDCSDFCMKGVPPESLEHISIKCLCYFNTAAKWRTIGQVLPRLTYLEITESRGLTTSLVEEVFLNLSSLKYLRLPKWSGFELLDGDYLQRVFSERPGFYIYVGYDKC